MMQIAEGCVSHARSGKVKNSFRYPIFYLRFDVDQESELSKLFSEKFRFFSIDSRLYLSGIGAKSLKEEIRDFLIANFDFSPEQILLQTMPKMFGYGFNPINFWFCLKNKKIEAVLCEVNNTFGQRHFYWIHDSSALIDGKWVGANKEFHVSPFFPVEGQYKFKFEVKEENYKVQINYFGEDGDLRLATWVSGSYRPILEANQFRLFFKYGWISVFVISRIHYQALKLWLKGAHFYKIPKNRKTVITK